MGGQDSLTETLRNDTLRIIRFVSHDSRTKLTTVDGREVPFTQYNGSIFKLLLSNTEMGHFKCCILPKG